MRKLDLLYILVLLLAIHACTPKVGTLRSPDYKGDVGAGSSDKSSSAAHAGDKAKEDGKSTGKKNILGTNVALVLPFQLDRIAGGSVQEEDVKRSALALDFYQGFQMGLEELSKKGKHFYLNVLDSKDDERQNIALAKSDSVQEAAIVVGPVYPKEIKSFGGSQSNKNIIQVNPLAATLPSEFNLPNLVSLTPSIKAHASAIAKEVAKEYTAGDVIVLYNTSDNDSRQFMEGMLVNIRQAKSGVQVVSVSSVTQLNENLSNTGFTHIVAGTTDKMQIKTLLTNLVNKGKEGVYNFQLYGHPLWDRYDWSIYADFASFTPRITAENALKGWTTTVKNFKDAYANTYGVQPSDHSYKGYDCAIYFGDLVNKYGIEHVKEGLLKETYEGIFSKYRFKHSPTWGYYNDAVSVRIYRNGSFQLQ